MFCVSEELINDKDLDKLESELTPRKVKFMHFDMGTGTGTGSSCEGEVYNGELVDTVLDNLGYLNRNEHERTWVNGKKVGKSAEFGDCLNQNGNNEVLVLGADNPNLFPTSSRRNRK